ncbi:MAG: hypothetical protein LAO20_01470 [Acidobacteriia bacterium]|nr:hypothetical protein [Terriglobia bacterium]
MDRVAGRRSFPWLSWAGLISSVCIAVGLYWDISWHEAIGRDTFWTPAHLLIQFGAVLTGLCAGWVILQATFSRDPALRASTVSVLGFRGPLGAFISAWGGVAMITSAPFDNWWHEAYGLDVKIISPPHVLLALGIAGINWGAALGTIAEMNRSEGRQRQTQQRILLALGGFIVLQGMILKLEYTNRVLLHSAVSYLVISIGLLLMLESLARAAGHRWARTMVAGVYSLFVLLMLWILPLFSAQPKLGPVYQQITHFVPLPFPILLIVPAFVLDLVWPAMTRVPRWQQALVGGVAFLAILIAVQWPFATFLMSPAARNWFFAPPDFPYFAMPSSPTVRHVFVGWEKTSEWFWRNMSLAFLASVLSMWVGIVFGDWLKKVRR